MIMSEKLKEVEKMIVKVMKKRDLSRNAAIDYMLIVATGRLAALYRYDDSLPEGKYSKGILALASPRKKRAPKTPKIAPSVTAETKEAAPKTAKKRKPAKRKPKTKAQQTEIAEVAAAE